MFNRLGRGVTGHPLAFIVFWLVLTAGAVVGVLWGFGQGGLFDRLENSTSLVPGSDSDEVNSLVASGGGESVMVVISGVDVPSQLPALTTFMAGHQAGIADVSGVVKFVNPIPMLASKDQAMQQTAATMIADNKDGFLLLLTLDPKLGDADQKAARDAAHKALKDAVGLFNTALGERFPGATATQVSQSLLGDTIIEQVQADLVTGETISLPVALVLLVIVFGGVLAAGLPLAGAIISILIGLGAIWALTFINTVDSFILNVISIIGVALSIDYGLLVVSRYREQLSAELASQGYPADGSRIPREFAAKEIVQAAVQATVATAGRTVAFSALTIACALGSLLTMTSPLLTTMATAGMVVTLLAVAMAVTVVPALIVLMNRALIQRSVLSRIPGVRHMTRTLGDSATDEGFFSRLAHGVHKHPWVVMLLVLIILVIMASPILNLKMRTVFDDFLPADHPTTQAYHLVQSDYPYIRRSSIVVVADTTPDKTAALHQYLKTLDGVDFVSPPTTVRGDDSRTIINVHVDAEDQVGQQVTDMVKSLRAYDAGVPLLIGGSAALQYDFLQSVIDAAPLALGIMIGAVLLLLFLMTGSVIVPLKALIINSLSLIASLGTASYIFENGLLGMPKVLGLETFILVCAVCFGFGLAMDYEVFLLARIKEYWDGGHQNDEAVEMGLQRSGRIITSAAAIIVAVFIGFTFGNMPAIKQIGVMLAITVVTDATLVRMLLVPATMTVLGKWNWWAPRPLRALYRHMPALH